MAGIWERISLITRSNVNEILSKFEDPEKMVEQLIIDAKKEYAQAKKESLPVFANETRLKKELDELQASAEKWHKVAGNALRSGNEEDARKALEKENQIKEKISQTETTYQSAKAASEKLRGKLSNMENEIRKMEDRRQDIKAKAATTKAIRATEKVASKDFGGSAFAAFDRMEEKAAKDLVEAEALEEMNRDTVSEEEEDLQKKYLAGGNAGTDEALAKLKEELGL